MYLKTLTLKGFKSFADPTTIDLEPGVTVVVGPNGSGKSNVVDAVAWVLGAQGPSVVRSAKMDDVIFAGTEKRSALGRAEVSLTIDNAARRLPIDFNEVTVSRTLFRNGDSEYALNGAPCRLLDVQELLSDSGVGRQQHVIVGQGQLDAVLTARPEDRRAIIEEAAGVLKYRRRRERAERRLESSEAALARLEDLLREVHRQLRPLERQAAAALRHEQLASEQRGLRLHLARAELGDLRDRLSSGDRRRDELDAETAITGADLARTWAAMSLAGESVGDTGDGLVALLGRLEAERLRCQRALALCQERRRAGERLAAALESQDQVATLEAETARVAADLERTVGLATALTPEWDELVRDEERLAADEGHAAGEGLASGEGHAAGEGLAAGEGGLQDVDPRGPAELSEARTRVVACREALATAREVLVRTTERAASLGSRIDEHEARLARGVTAAALCAEQLVDARTEQQRSVAQEEAARAAADSATSSFRLAEEKLHVSGARVEALGLALDEARARAGVERLAELPGVIGTLLDVVEIGESVAMGFEAALEGVLAGVLVTGYPEARLALARLGSDGLGGAVIPLGLRKGPTARGGDGGARRVPAPTGTELLRTHVVSRDPEVEALLDHLLDGVVLCAAGIEAAIEVAQDHPELAVVTPEGDRVSASGWRLGAGGAGATRAALDDASRRLQLEQERASQAGDVATSAVAEHEQARVAAAAALRRLDKLETDHRNHVALVAELTGSLEALAAEARQVAEAHERARQVLAEAEAALAADESRLAVVEAAELEASARREVVVAARRAMEVRARTLAERRRDLDVRSATLEERRILLVVRSEELAERVAARRDEEQAAEGRRRGYDRVDRALGHLTEIAESCLAAIEETATTVRVERDRLVAEAQARAERVRSLVTRRDALERVLAGVRDRRQRLEIELTEARVRHESAVETLRRDLDLSPDEIAADTSPQLGTETDASARLRAVEDELRRLGPVNPLAREELAALEERAGFLRTQLEDVRHARRELGQVIGSIDDEIVGVFQSAFADVAGHFHDLFDTLFPGGTGKLTLSAPDDPLTTGIEIEARPAGRNVRRLSLLSGGERSLVAMAFLFAVFRSRPSPFYLMDEVEAALDEVNLQRFLDLVDEFREEAQLIIVSHQKRTMAIADALYGVSLQPGGGSKVVSERLGSRRAPVAQMTGEPR